MLETANQSVHNISNDYNSDWWSLRLRSTEARNAAAEPSSFIVDEEPEAERPTKSQCVWTGSRDRRQDNFRFIRRLDENLRTEQIPLRLLYERGCTLKATTF